jgi:hypothetical protein
MCDRSDAMAPAGFPSMDKVSRDATGLAIDKRARPDIPTFAGISRFAAASGQARADLDSRKRAY